MKFNIEVDCTPEEVRGVLGLPDLTLVHQAYTDKMVAAVEKGVTPDMVESMVRTWMPMGDAGMDFVKQLMGGIGAASKKKS